MSRRRRIAQGLALVVVLAVVVLASALSASAAERCPAPDRFANTAGLAAMAQGFNMPGWDRAGRPGGARLKVLAELRDRAFTHVRLPIDDARLRVDGRAAEDAEAYLGELGLWIAALHQLGYAVSVDLHPGGQLGELFRSDPAAALEETKAIWTRLAPVVAAFDPATTYAELLNEPPVGPAIWNRQLPDLAAYVRRLLPRHTLVVAPFGPQRHESLIDIPALADRNIVYAIHYYDPFAFTHQGADWLGDGSVMPQLSDLPWPSPPGDPLMAKRLGDLDRRGRDKAVKVVEDSLLDGWTEQDMGRAFAVMADWSTRTGRPVIVNEFGVYAGAAPRAARLRWLKAAAAEARAHCIGWTHWDYEDGFGMVDAQNRPDADVLQALVPDDSETGR